MSEKKSFLKSLKNSVSVKERVMIFLTLLVVLGALYYVASSTLFSGDEEVLSNGRADIRLGLGENIKKSGVFDESVVGEDSLLAERYRENRDAEIAEATKNDKTSYVDSLIPNPIDESKRDQDGSTEFDGGIQLGSKKLSAQSETKGLSALDKISREIGSKSLSQSEGGESSNAQASSPAGATPVKEVLPILSSKTKDQFLKSFFEQNSYELSLKKEIVENDNGGLAVFSSGSIEEKEGNTSESDSGRTNYSLNNSVEQNAKDIEPAQWDYDYPAGKVFSANLDIGINTDSSRVVRATIVGPGRLNGAILIGDVARRAERAVIQFSTMSINNREHSINAIALDMEGEIYEGIADEVDHHYFSRIILPGVTAFLNSYSAALTGYTSVNQSDGSSTETINPIPKVSDRIIASAGSIGSAITTEINNARPDTLTVKAYKNRLFGIMLLTGLDLK